MIDAHHHFWQYSTKEYGWIGDNMAKIRRDFLPFHLHEEMKAAGVRGAVPVQARQTLEESEWLVGLAERHDFLMGVVGWVPLVDPGVGKHLERLARHKKFKGVRHVVQDEPDINYLLRPDFNRGIGMLRQFNLVYDILIFEKHLSRALQFVDQHPKQVFVLDHIAKPRIKEKVLAPWQQQIREMAKRENVYCKLSGMVTEAEWGKWTEADLKPYIDTVLEAFGAKRLMFGSDWPVMLVASSYGQWAGIVKKAVGKLSAAEQGRILEGNAVEAYKL